MTVSELSTMTAEELAAEIERVEDEIAVAREGLKDLYTEAKSRGLDVSALRKIHALRKLKPEVRSVVGVYADKLGVFDVMD